MCMLSKYFEINKMIVLIIWNFFIMMLILCELNFVWVLWRSRRERRRRVSVFWRRVSVWWFLVFFLVGWWFLIWIFFIRWRVLFVFIVYVWCECIWYWWCVWWCWKLRRRGCRRRSLLLRNDGFVCCWIFYYDEWCICCGSFIIRSIICYFFYGLVVMIC